MRHRASDLRQQSDEELVAASLAGSAAAFEALVRRHRRTILAAIGRIAEQRADCEDIFQETCLVLHRRLASFRGESRLSTWLSHVAVNAALAHRRRARRARGLEARAEEYFDCRQALLPSSAAVDGLAEQRERGAAALRMISSLPAIYRDPFVLREIEELDTHDTAAALRISTTLVRKRVSRARLMLKRLRREGEQTPTEPTT